MEVISTPLFQKRLDEQGGAVVKMTSAEFGKLMVSEQNKWLEVIRVAGIKGE
jgi:tripartite-type tricarboxylate transporter receptor subunit TctC